MTIIRHHISVLFLMLATICHAQSEYVNPMIGASTDVGKASAYHGLGKTFPGAATPYGMVQVSPQTITGGDNGSGYSDEHRTIEGFAMTQMSGIGWYGDLGNFMVMPTNSEKIQFIAGSEDGKLEGWRSAYDKQSETASAGYYKVHLTRYDIDTECTATTHCGFLRFTFPKSQHSCIQIDLARRVGGTSTRQSARFVDDHTIEGHMECTPDGGGWGNGDGKARYTVFFHATFSKPITERGFWSADIPDGQDRHRDAVTSPEYLQHIQSCAKIIRNEEAIEGKHIGIIAGFTTDEREQVEMKVGISFVDIEGARCNYLAEANRTNFDKACRQAKKAWDEALSCIDIKGGTEDERTVFYTSLYHTMIDPRIYQDVNGRYMGGDYHIHQAKKGQTRRTIFSGWDVFRSQFPLQTIIHPQLVSDMINSLTDLAEESGNGYYERWELLGAYSGCMLGNPALSIITDAYAKGIRTFDADKALRYAIASAEKFGNGDRGYTPGSLSHTLEYAYTDWCLARFAEMLGKKDVTNKYDQKSKAYRNIWSDEVHWFRPRNNDGSWSEWPKEGRLREGYGAMECNPYQQGWFVPHDIDGMVELMGGREAVIADLDNLFENTPQDMFWNQYYNHANEPVHHIPYLFNRLGEPRRTQRWTRFICSHAYDNNVAGLKGNEDVGQMSAWYVLSAAGLHPVCPGETRMEITSPVFSRVTFRLDKKYHKGKTFTVIAHDNSPENVYIQHMLLNGKPLTEPCIDYSKIAAGGVLELFMGK